MLDERNNCLSCSSSRPALTTLAAHSGVLGLLRSAGKAAPQIAAAVHQVVCTRRALHPRCNSLRSGEVVASSRQPPTAVAAGRGPAVSPTPRLCFWGSVGPKPRLLLGLYFTCATSQNVLIPCVEKTFRTPGIRRSARHAGLAGMAADASGPPQHELLKVGALDALLRPAGAGQRVGGNVGLAGTCRDPLRQQRRGDGH